MTNTEISKFLSLILRHKPETIHLKLDLNGWAEVSELIDGINRGSRFTIDRNILENVVKNDSKQRYIFSKDKSKIRANQGHSIEVDLNLQPTYPLKILFHGTATKNIESIKEKGIMSQSRNHVHLSSDYGTAVIVGKRHGIPYVLTIDSELMFEEGHLFYLSDNGVWLTNKVPVKYIRF